MLEILSLCELLDCDVDYLIGKQEYARENNLNAMQKTGLEEITIEEISELSISEKHIIDAMFSRTNISFSFIGLIKKMLFYSHPQVKNNSHITLDKELPRFNADGKIEIVWEIGFIGNKILDRLTEREEIGNHFDYHIDWLHNVSDFSAMMKEKRLNMSKDDYRVWLNKIERKTR